MKRVSRMGVELVRVALNRRGGGEMEGKERRKEGGQVELACRGRSRPRTQIFLHLQVVLVQNLDKHEARHRLGEGAFLVMVKVAWKAEGRKSSARSKREDDQRGPVPREARTCRSDSRETTRAGVVTHNNTDACH
jgi:hypothetical protein